MKVMFQKLTIVYIRILYYWRNRIAITINTYYSLYKEYYKIRIKIVQIIHF